MAGEIVACELVKLACKRHLRDLETGGSRGLVWRPDAAQYRIGFYPRFLRHSKGEWARKPVELAPWQKFIVGSVYGWKRADGTRRFRYVYQEVARKNGKSTMLAGVGLDMLVCDGEPGAEVYAAATKKDQARIIFEEAKRMVGSSPALTNALNKFKLNISIDATASKFEPLSSDENTLDGLNPHCVLIDELHKHKTRALLDVMDTAVGARRQPLIWIITTAGDDNPASVYANEHGYAVDVLEGTLENDSVFAFVATIDSKPRDEVLTGISALRHLDETCICGNVPPTLVKQFLSEACANHATDGGGKKTRLANVPIIPIGPITQKDCVSPATTDPLSSPTPLEKSEPTPLPPNGVGLTQTDVEQSPLNTGQSQTQSEKRSPRDDWRTTESPKPNTTNAMPNSKGGAGYAGKDPGLYAWITNTARKLFGDFSAGNAIRELVFSETLRNIYFAHSPTCAARKAQLKDNGLLVTIPADRWDDPAAWAKANPNLGISVKLDDLERQALKAKGSPSALNAFKRLRLNVRTSDTDRVIDAETWNQNSSGRWDPDKLPQKMRCWGGLDLSSKIDITAWVKLFEPDAAGVMKVATRFWMPADTIDQRSDRDRAHYRQWVNEGWIEPTVGNVIDHDEIYRAIIADKDRFTIESMAFDPWSSQQLGIKLNGEGVEAFEFVQGIRSYTAPTKELQALLAARRLDHGDNPVLRWMAANLAVQRDKNLNEMPHKAHSTGRIDGMTALIMAIGRQMQPAEATGSIYDDPSNWGESDVAIQP